MNQYQCYNTVYTAFDFSGQWYVPEQRLWNRCCASDEIHQCRHTRKRKCSFFYLFIVVTHMQYSLYLQSHFRLRCGPELRLSLALKMCKY